ncbi:matrixin domain protein [Lactobacillus psittaci DSM 15354]|uniref:Matrixin domain protein n=1 Tax=Lactobacillus psittaci DSM 15354 TaxID=1122152 RepID=A0A0R1S4B6_9LACO|nr:matrixin domain protein [Lactobacillus psittaci DSM 15354]
MFAFTIHLYQTDSNLRTAANNSIAFLKTKLQQTILPNTQSSASNDTASKGDYRWSKNSASVYIDLDNQTLYNASVEAINSWNNTGSFTFTLTQNKKNANIIIKTMDDDTTNAAGLTSTSYNPITKKLLKATVKLNSYYLLNGWFGYDHSRIVNTAEHELGHAIGLKHNKGVSVMYPEGSYYTIQPADVSNVEKLYNEDNQKQNSNQNQSNAA